MYSRCTTARSLILGGVLAAGCLVAAATWGAMMPTGTAKLVAFEPLPPMTGETCEWEVATPQTAAISGTAFQTAGGARAGQSSEGGVCGGADCAQVAGRAPIRLIQDEDANFSSIAVDPVRNEVVMTDENRFRVMVYDRTANTPPGAARTAPKRVINGLRTHTQFASDVYIDPPTGEIYVVNNDTVHNTTVYGRTASGDAPPDREFVTPYGNFAIAADEEKQEVFLTVQHNGVILAYRKNSGMAPEDHAIRRIQGTNTRMADSHGIAFDSKNKLLFVANWGAQHQAVEGHEGYPGRPRIPLWPIGNYHHEILRGTGRWVPPSITVFPSDGNGNIAPVRVIEGPKAQLQWPTGLAIDSGRGELYVANSAGDAITVFSATASGDVAPVRVLKGPRTLLREPTDVFLDLVNDELWVANYGNHMAAVYRRTASGDTAPIRMIRSAPLNTPTPLLGNPYSIAYDAKREQILVPNCVAHPRIAAFARLADKSAGPVRSIEGQNTGLHRTMHAIGYDDIHDEIVVPLLMAQAIATFRGGASGDEKPIRVIQGPKTHNQRVEHLSLDPVNNEIYVWEENRTMVFDRLAQGDVAPKRVIEGVTNVAVDPIHNLLISIGGRRIRIYDRTVEGKDPKPLRVIQGPRTALGGASTVRLYPPAGRIVVIVRGGRGEGGGDDGGLESASSASPESLASERSFTGIWSIYDEGDVPPRWSIGGPDGLLRNPRGVTLDPVNKAIMISDKYLNGILTYSFPELFNNDNDPRQTAQR